MSDFISLPNHHKRPGSGGIYRNAVKALQKLGPGTVHYARQGMNKAIEWVGPQAARDIALVGPYAAAAVPAIGWAMGGQPPYPQNAKPPGYMKPGRGGRHSYKNMRVKTIYRPVRTTFRKGRKSSKRHRKYK